jgi:hypothetical protein
MELGQYQLQIFVSLVGILSAAFVALICDFLQRNLQVNNAQLRELTIELKARREGDQKRSRLAPPHAVERAGLPTERKRAGNSEALAAMERGAALAGARTLPRSAPVPPAREPKSEPKPEMPKPAPIRERIRVTQQEDRTQSPIKIAVRKDWGSLLTRNAQARETEQKTGIPIVAKEDLVLSSSAQSAEKPLPAGFHDRVVLNKLIESRQTVSGLVVSIGVKGSCKSDGALPESVHELVQSLIGANDFAAQSSEDDFLLIYPQERGASAQRRLSQIAQQLWDFQLSTLGWFEILFSWGGVEVRCESLEEAIASASERMQETKRGRKLCAMAASATGFQTQIRKAV